MHDTIKNPTVVLEQAQGKHIFISDNAVAAVDSNGILFTTYGRDRFGDNILEVLKAVKWR